uniref:Uncharacterized protein n=1 Tax=Romanomermis culicivorax TaxID=13658 RepID=A0A915KSH3_ROMCU
MGDEILALNWVNFYDYKVSNMCFCLYNHPNLEHSTKALGQKMHLAKLPSSKGNKQNTSSLTNDKKTEPYDNIALCAEVINRALCSNDITSTHHAVGAPMLLLFLLEIDQDMVMSDELKQTKFNLIVSNPFTTYGPPKNWPIYEIKSDYQISEMPALAPLYTVPNHNEWMNAIRGTMSLAVHVCSLHSEMEQQAIIQNEILKLLSKSDNIEIDLICKQNWIKRNGTFEPELTEWVSRIPPVEKICNDNKQPVYANRLFVRPIVFRKDSFPVSNKTELVTKKKYKEKPYYYF